MNIKLYGKILINAESLAFERKVRNPHDPFLAAIKKTISGESTIVGHVLQRISLMCSIFLRQEKALTV